MRKELCSTCNTRPRRNHTSYTCKECHNEYQKQYYKLKPLSINTSAKNRKLDIRTFVIKAKDTPCKDCNIKYPYYVMDFDYVRGKKDFELARAASHYRSLDTIQKEIDKCDVVCSNCHRIRTFTRMSSSVIGNTSDFDSEDFKFEP